MRRDASRVASRAIAWLVVVSVLASSCASKQVIGVRVASDKPVEPEADEVRLWNRAEDEEAQIQKRVKAYDDPLLEAYLARIVERLTSADVRGSGAPAFSITVLRDPTLNAFAMPNGRIYVHTGLLARLDNEAQLAMILGHEITHVTKRHALRSALYAQNPQALFTVPVLSPTAQVVLGHGLQVAALAAISGYGGDLEREADAGGMARLVQAGYDPNEAPKLCELLSKESKDRGSLETFFLGNQARLIECIEDTSRLVRTQYAVSAANPPYRMTSTEEFGLRMWPLVRENARLDIQAGRFTLAAGQLDRVLTIGPTDPIAQLYYGDLYRLQSQRSRDAADRADKAKKARERYERSAELDPTYPDPFRQLGLLYYQQNENARAREAFQRYLELKPDAADAGRIKEYLAEIDR
jgi:predicted Zn-dependent protease